MVYELLGSSIVRGEWKNEWAWSPFFFLFSPLSFGGRWEMEEVMILFDGDDGDDGEG